VLDATSVALLHTASAVLVAALESVLVKTIVDEAVTGTIDVVDKTAELLAQPLGA
jgi:hypothetical protein